ncbi:MAG: CpsB/CapC family capsule biosynthesis tyrosine phosphatase, partial [Motiliproteus sp.]
CYFLPGVDDGAQTLEQALDLARLSVADGIEHAVLTPHIHPGRYDNDLDSLQAPFQRFSEALVDADIPLTISLAAEVHCTPELLQMIPQQQIPFIGEYRGESVLLLEFPHAQIPVGSDKLVTWLRNQQVLPLIAHPERNKSVLRDLSVIEPFVKLGCLLQVTAGSLVGGFGPACQQVAEELLRRGWVSVLATDAHNSRHRPPRMTAGHHAAIDIVGPQAAEALVWGMPRQLLGLTGV